MSDKRKSRPAGGRPGRKPAGKSVPPSPRSHEGEAAGKPEVRERVAKRIARSGLASRRDAEAMVVAGRVKVNGNLLSSPAFNVSSKDVILVDGERLPERERTRLFLFHKPSGTMTTNRDPEGRKTIFDVLPKGLPRLMTIGRLDFTTEGLLLMTNDGGLARVLELPSTGWLRRYRVRVHGTVDPAALKGLKDGIAVDGVLYGAIDAELERQQGSNAWLLVSLREGKNREIKNVLGALGLEVARLIRISYGPFQLGNLGPGEIMELKGRTLRDQLGERLIAEAGADFEGEILKPFSNKPAAKDDAEAVKPERHGSRDRQPFRDEGLDRLQTRKPYGAKPRDKERAFEKDQPQDKKRGFEPPRSRATNVWMAPGARPQGGKVKRVTREEIVAAKKSGKDKKRGSGSERSDARNDAWKSRGKKDADRRR